MTIKTKLVSELTSMGLFENQAIAIVEAAQPKLGIPDRPVNLNDPADSYPDVMYRLWMVLLKRIAIEHIDQHCPEA